jgi:hypothetical protein
MWSYASLLIVGIALGGFQFPLGEEKLWVFSYSSAFTHYGPPYTHTIQSKSLLRKRNLAHSVYNPPSPAKSCSGTATSVKMKAVMPQKQLFIAMAVEEWPGFTSTMYTSVLE